MRRLSKPSDCAKEVFELCISKISDEDFKRRLGAISKHVKNFSNYYDAMATAGRLFKIKQHETACGVSKHEMESIYTDRMAKLQGPGRSVYDKLRNSSPHNICPLCAQREVKTLDHQLPKKPYPALAVTPLNLVPACRDCNTDKKTSAPGKMDEQTLHPYYDDVTKRAGLGCLNSLLRFYKWIQSSLFMLSESVATR